MKKFKTQQKCLLFIFPFIFLISYNDFAQTSDGKKSDYLNSVKFNLTNNLLYDNAFQFGYERVLSNRRSFTLFVGYQEFPSIIATQTQNDEFTKDLKKSGYSFGGDYRFYLSNENKYHAPRGVYIGPFVSYFSFSNERTLTHILPTGNEVGKLDTDLYLINLGGELGYQFVFGRRWVLDAIICGPSLTQYKFKAKLDSNFTVDPDGTAAAVIEALKAKFPLLNDLGGGEVAKSGIQDLWSGGFRYSFSVGYRF